MNPAMQAYFLYLQSRGAKSMVNRVNASFKNGNKKADYYSQQRDADAEKISQQWDTYRTGNTNTSKLNQTRAAAGTMLHSTSTFQRSMANNYMLAAAPKYVAQTIQGTVGLANSAGIHSHMLNAIGAHAGNVASAFSPAANVFRYAQYINPMYAATSTAASALFKGIGGAVGNPILGQMLAGPAAALAMPLITKLTTKAANLISGPGMTTKQAAKLKPISIDAKLHSASEFVNENSIQSANQLISQLYASADKSHNIDPVQIAQLQYMAEITAYTSSLPILTSEVVNNFIKKGTASATTYNNNLHNKENYFKGMQYQEAANRRADREAHGKFSNTVTQNIGMAATEASAFLNKMSLLLDPIQQIQLVLSGGNIKDQLKKFDKAFQTREQQNASIYAKTMGIGKEESYANMYYSINDDSQSVLAKAKTFEDAQIGLLSGVYEFTRMTALETATMRVKGYGIKEPIKYNVIGENDSQAKGIFNWLSNKIPGFELLRTLFGAGKNTLAYLTGLGPKTGLLGALNTGLSKIVGAHRVTRFHDERFNRLAENFDIRRETTLMQRLAEPFIDKLNKKLLETPVLKIFGNKNRLSLEERARLKQQEEKGKITDELLKELGFEKLSAEQKYYKYATTSMPAQYDLMVHHLANIGVFSHATMLNTAALAKVMAGKGHVEKPLALKNRTINPYTGVLETDEDHLEFEKYMFKMLNKKAVESSRESKKSWAKGLDTLKYMFGKKDVNKDEELLGKGVREGLQNFYSQEKNTSEGQTGFFSSLLNRTLFTEDFLDKLKNDEFRKNVVNSEFDKDKYINNAGGYLSNAYGNADSAQLASLEASMLKVDVARISAPEFNRTYFNNPHSRHSSSANNSQFSPDNGGSDTTRRAAGLSGFYSGQSANNVAPVDAIGRVQRILRTGTGPDIILNSAGTSDIGGIHIFRSGGATGAPGGGYRIHIGPDGRYRGDATHIGPMSRGSNPPDYVDSPENTSSSETRKSFLKRLALGTWAILTQDDAYNNLKNTIKSPFAEAWENTKWGFEHAKSGIGEALGATFGGLKDAIYTEPKNAAKRGMNRLWSKTKNAAANQYGNYKWAYEHAKSGIGEALGATFGGLKDAIYTEPKNAAKRGMNRLWSKTKNAAANQYGNYKWAYEHAKSGIGEALGATFGGLKDAIYTEPKNAAKRGMNSLWSKTKNAAAYVNGAFVSAAGSAYAPYIDNSIEDVKNAENRNKESYQEKTLKLFSSMVDSLKVIKKESIFSNLKAKFKNAVTAGKNLLSNGLSAIGAGTVTAIAAGASLGYGAYKAMFGREKALIDKLDREGIIDYNFFGKSTIKRWDIVAKMPLSQLTQLLSFDDWDDETRKRLQKLVDAESKNKVAADTQLKLVFKNKKDFNKFVKNRDAELRKKEGFFGYHLGKIATGARHGADWLLTGFGIFGHGNSKDRTLYSQLEDAGVIDYSTLPFVHSKVRDWDAITKLSTSQLKSLLKLSWDSATEKRLKEIYNIRSKESKHLDDIKLEHLKKDAVSNAAKLNKQNKNVTIDKKPAGMFTSAKDKVANLFGSNDVVNAMIRQGDIKHHIWGDSEITAKGWKLIPKLSAEQVKSIIDFNDWDDKTKALLLKIYKAKAGSKDSAKQKKVAEVLTAKNAKNTPKPLASGTDLDNIVNSSQVDASSKPIEEKFDELIGAVHSLIQVTAGGHKAQAKATSSLVDALDSKTIDKLGAPIAENLNNIF